MRIKAAERGDTIVEVLIAILVISSILAGAFVSARKSQSAIRQSQERVEALNVAEGQIERVRSAASSNPSSFYSDTNSFCMSAADGAKYGLSTPPALADDDFTVYGDAVTGCTFTPNAGVAYHAFVKRNDKDTFTVRVRWDGVDGIGKQETMIALRVPKP